MDWLGQHIEVIAYVAGAVLTFTIWNTKQGIRLKDVEKAVGSFTERSYMELQKGLIKQFEHYDGEIKAIRVRQDTVEKGLTDELRRIGEKLAHIEGFLTAKKTSSRKP